MYYLNARYYDAEIGRFNNADSLVAGIGGSTHGYNVFAYCFNNPVNMIDEMGLFPIFDRIKHGISEVVDWVDEKVVQPAVEFFNDAKEVFTNVVEDFKNYNSNNQSEADVFSSHYFSNYKGVLVIKTPSAAR